MDTPHNNNNNNNLEDKVIKDSVDGNGEDLKPEKADTQHPITEQEQCTEYWENLLEELLSEHRKLINEEVELLIQMEKLNKEIQDQEWGLLKTLKGLEPVLSDALKDGASKSFQNARVVQNHSEIGENDTTLLLPFKSVETLQPDDPTTTTLEAFGLRLGTPLSLLLTLSASSSSCQSAALTECLAVTSKILDWIFPYVNINIKIEKSSEELVKTTAYIGDRVTRRLLFYKLESSGYFRTQEEAMLSCSVQVIQALHHELSKLKTSNMKEDIEIAMQPVSKDTSDANDKEAKITITTQQPKQVHQEILDKDQPNIDQKANADHNINSATKIPSSSSASSSSKTRQTRLSKIGKNFLNSLEISNFIKQKK